MTVYTLFLLTIQKTMSLIIDTLEKMLIELDILMTKYISTRDILMNRHEEEENDPDYVPLVTDWRLTIYNKLEKIGVYEKVEEINKFLKDYKDKYGNDDTYNIMNNKIDIKYKFFHKNIVCDKTLDKLLMEFNNLKSKYINTQNILYKNIEDEYNNLHYKHSVCDSRDTIYSQLERIDVDVDKKVEEINKFLKDYKDKYGKDNVYKHMSDKIDRRYKFY